MTVREDAVRRPSGAEGIFGVVEKPDFVVILAIEHDSIYLVEQYRYAVGGRYWELPQGTWESKPAADPAQLAAGELKEETGLIAHTMEYVGHQFLAYGYSNQGYHIYIAKELEQSTQMLDKEEEGLVSRAFRLETFESMICEGVIKDATTVNAYGFARLKGLI